MGVTRPIKYTKLLGIANLNVYTVEVCQSLKILDEKRFESEFYGMVDCLLVHGWKEKNVIYRFFWDWGFVILSGVGIKCYSLE